MSDDTSRDGLQFNRTPVYISLAIAIVLVVAVLFGAKWYFDQATNTPVAMGAVDAPEADSPQCQSLIDDLPAELLGHDRAELTEPKPAGAAAWQTTEIERITLRCGVAVPLQYDEYTQTEQINGVEWLRVDDYTPESTLSTWYTVDRYPVVAVTADDHALGGAENPVENVPVDQLEQREVEPYPAPLSNLAAGDASVAGACGALMEVLPEDVADGYSPLAAGTGGAELDPNTAVWTAPGAESIVLRCGVADPENYQPGEQLHQINDVTWFEDTQLINGSTASTWFALGREANVAVSMPQFAGNSAIVRITEAIEKALPAK
ncbi:DUF3515 domain-containing protein [Corynebacterium cystitidis]|uniref:DUF3515 domain-containing protein n=1 Tax=Corynebacterium cystitidis TaxID=35757 RepID=UPI00211ED58F|nr:DUF3515 domain-containing protein [Corynebacterium cystitidis]